MANQYVTFAEAGLLDAAALMRANPINDFGLALAEATEDAAWQMIREREQRAREARHPDTAHFYPVCSR